MLGEEESEWSAVELYSDARTESQCLFLNAMI